MGGKMKKQKDLSGTVIELTKSQKEFVKEANDRRWFARVAFEEASKFIAKSSDDFWKAIYNFYPELKKYRFNLNAETGEISIVSKKIKDSNSYI